MSPANTRIAAHRWRLAIVLCLVAHAALAWTWRWVGDDGFIAFRYARNLAHGHGLVFNPGEAVEGYTQLLWVLIVAAVEALGLEVTRATAAIEVAFAVFLSSYVARTAWCATSRGAARASAPVVATGAALFMATSPSVIVWSTGGLGTIVHALLAFAVVERLVATRRGAHWGLAAAAAIGLTLARFDGLYHLALALAGAVLVARRTGDQRLLRDAGRVLAASALAFALQTAWRLAVYGDLVPNTAHAKVAVSARTLERGAEYVLAYWLSIPTALVLLVLLVARAARRPSPTLRPDPGSAAESGLGDLLTAGAVVALGTFAYPVLVGGDFMPMGRFIVPALPFLALVAGALGAHTAARHGTLAATALGALLLAGWLPALFGAPPTPRAWREAVSFRWGRPYQTEARFRRGVIERAEHWAWEGRALAQHLAPDASLVRGAVGAVGYYSGIVLHDRFGLTDRRAAREFTPDLSERVMPGHDRRAPVTFFADREPDFWYSNLVFGEGPGTQRYDALAASPLTASGDVLVFRVFAADGFPADGALVLVRYGVEVPGLVP